MTATTGLDRRAMLRAGVAGMAAAALPLATVHGQNAGGRLASPLGPLGARGQ